MNYQLTLMSVNENPAINNLKIDSPAVPRIGELIQVEVHKVDYELKVKNVIYDFLPDKCTKILIVVEPY